MTKFFTAFGVMAFLVTTSSYACTYGSYRDTETCMPGDNSTCFGQKTSGTYCIVRNEYCNARITPQGVVERFWEVQSTSTYFIDAYDMICPLD